jgi:hypothetical protein
MKTLQKIFVLALMFFSLSAKASELEFFAGANSTTYDDSSDANTWGVGLRLQYNLTQNDNTWLINLNAPGISIIAGQVHVGYIWRSHGDWFWQGGLAAGYGLIFGADATLIAGFGYHVTQRFFFDFPAYAGTSALAFLPMFGFDF